MYTSVRIELRELIESTDIFEGNELLFPTKSSLSINLKVLSNKALIPYDAIALFINSAYIWAKNKKFILLLSKKLIYNILVYLYFNVLYMKRNKMEYIRK